MKSIIFKIIIISLLSIFSYAAPAESVESHLPLLKQKKGYLALSVPVKLDALIPTQSMNAHTKYILPLIFEPLITINAKQELQPILAQSWIISSDHKTIIITIKSGHIFSDNREVTAQDIVDSVSRLCSPESQEYEELNGLLGCADHAKGKAIEPQISAIGKYQIQFKITSSPTNFLYQLSSPNAVITKKIPSGLIGSGPYIPNEKHEDYLILDKNSHYVGDNLTKNPGIILFYENQKNVNESLMHEKIDGAIIYRIADIINFKGDKYKLIISNPNITEILVLNNQRFPFSKTIVRQALSSAIYNHFNHSCIPGTRHAYGVIPNGIGGSINNSQPKYLPEITPIELFKKVPELKEKRISVVFHQLDDLKNDCESSQIIQVSKQYNIDVKFNYHKNYSTLVPLYLSHKLDGFVELYVFLNPDAYSVLQFFTKSGENNANVNNYHTDNMLITATLALSSHKRYQAYKTLTQYLQDEGVIIPLFYMNHGTLLKNCLGGVSDKFFFSPFIFLPNIYQNKSCAN